ncbi:SDR family oxidoreductase [Chloroflexota bacterium]
MSVLVTGGAGFIGSHICERLLREGYQVICLDNFDPYYAPNLKRDNIEPLLASKKFKLIEGDIREQKLVNEVIGQDIEYIFHYAAQPGVRASIENPLKPHEVNATGMLNILQAYLNSNVKKLINASSSSVYGKNLYLPFDEAHPTSPISPYGVSKLMAEHYCRVFSEIHGLNITSLRLFTVYGPRMRPDLAISIFTTRALKNETIEIFGDGSKTRDFTYIDDVVEANLLAMRKDGSEVYNIGSGSRISVNELAEKIIKLLDSKSRIIYTHPQRGDAEHTWANTDKAKKELGWKPNTTLEQGLESMTNWARLRHNL